MPQQNTAAIIIRDQKVLLIKRAEFEDSEPGKWCAPNETVEENESPESAVVRGVQEELGMLFTISNQLFDHSYQNRTTFVFEGIASGEITPSPEEVADYNWFSYQEAKHLEFAYEYDKIITRLHDLKLIKD